MNDVEIRLARPDDEAALREFIDRHWRKGHVLATSAELLRWQHATRSGNPSLNFVVGANKHTHEFYAILGFIPMWHNDPTLPHRDIFLAIWKVRADITATGLGIGLLAWLKETIASDMIVAVGLSRMVVPIYRALGYQTGRLNHHVLFNVDASEFRIARGVTTAMLALQAKATGNVATERMITTDAGKLPSGIVSDTIEPLCAARLPRKSWRYLCSRYAEHPAYRYRFSFVAGDDHVRCLLVWRKIMAQGSAALRIVDLLGDESALAASAVDLQLLLREEHAEYLDIQHFGVKALSLTAAGFVDRQALPDLIIPGHFEPFELRNVDLDFAYKIFDESSAGMPVRLLRGDSDQDRPNQWTT